MFVASMRTRARPDKKSGMEMTTTKTFVLCMTVLSDSWTRRRPTIQAKPPHRVRQNFQRRSADPLPLCRNHFCSVQRVPQPGFLQHHLHDCNILLQRRRYVSQLVSKVLPGIPWLCVLLLGYCSRVWHVPFLRAFGLN
jgi:hypothetical protein